MRITMKRKLMKIIPKIYLDLEELMRYVDNNKDLVGFPSMLKGVAYATDGKDALILTRRKGYLRIDANELKTLIEELQWIDEDIERRSRD